MNINKETEELTFSKSKHVDVPTSGLSLNLTSGRNSSKSRKPRDGYRKNDYQNKMPINKSYYRPFSSIISDADKQDSDYPDSLPVLIWTGSKGENLTKADFTKVFYSAIQILSKCSFQSFLHLHSIVDAILLLAQSHT